MLIWKDVMRFMNDYLLLSSRKIVNVKVESEDIEIFSKCKNNICDFVKSGGRVNISEMTHDDSDCQLLVSQQS